MNPYFEIRRSPVPSDGGTSLSVPTCWSLKSLDGYSVDVGECRQPMPPAKLWHDPQDVCLECWLLSDSQAAGTA